MIKPEFTRRVDLGHILQAGVIVVSVGCGIGTVFWTLQSQITAQAIQNAALQQEENQHESAIRQLQDNERRMTETINASLQKLGDELVSLQVLVAKKIR